MSWFCTKRFEDSTKLGLDLLFCSFVQIAAKRLRQGQETLAEWRNQPHLTMVVRRHYMFSCGLLKGQGGAVHTPGRLLPPLASFCTMNHYVAEGAADLVPLCWI